MPQYFTGVNLEAGMKFEITGNDFQHLKTVRRIKPGAEVNVRDAENRLFSCAVKEILKNSILLETVKMLSGVSEYPELIVAAALLKNRNLELVLQKCTEIGVSGFVPFISERTVVHPDKSSGKPARWNSILEEASKQSLRPDMPHLEDTETFADLIGMYSDHERIIAHLDREAPSLRDVVNSSVYDRYIIAIGPEGGFSEKEIKAAVSAGWKTACFGFTQMRAETASIAISSIIINEILEKKNKVL